jgi:hypothetical protein
MGSDGFTVSPSSLMQQSNDWYGYAGQLGQMGIEIGGTEWTGPDYGLFAPVIGPYQQACQQIAQWCTQGQMQTIAVGSALAQAAGMYQSADNNAGSNTGKTGRLIRLLNN